MMMELINVRAKKCQAILGCIVVVIGILFALYTYRMGLQGDDSYYLFETVGSLSTTIKRSLDATVTYYYTWNGRFVINFINILVVNLGMVTQTVGVVFILGSVIISLFHFLNCKMNQSGSILILLFLMLMATDEFLFNTSCLNISCNYLLPIPVYLYLCKVISENVEKYALSRWLILICVAFIAGSLIETYSFPLAIVVIILVLRRKLRVNVQNVVIGIAYACGALVLLLCPGSYARAGSLSDGILGVAYHANGIVGCFADWFIIAMIGLVVTLRLKKIRIHDFSRIEQCLLLYCAIQILVMCISPYFPPRALLMVNLIVFAIVIKQWVTSLDILTYRLIALMMGFGIAGQLMIAFGRILFVG